MILLISLIPLITLEKFLIGYVIYYLLYEKDIHKINFRKIVRID